MGVTRQPSSQTRSEATMDEDSAAPLEGAIRVDEKQLRGHIDEAVRSSVEETLNALLDAEAEQICRAQRYERSADRVDTRAGHYERKLQTKAGEVQLRGRGQERLGAGRDRGRNRWIPADPGRGRGSEGGPGRLARLPAAPQGPRAKRSAADHQRCVPRPG